MNKTFNSLQSWMLARIQSALAAASRLADEDKNAVETADRLARESAEDAVKAYGNPEAYDSFFRERYGQIHARISQEIIDEAERLHDRIQQQWDYYCNPTDCSFVGQKMARSEKRMHRRMCAMLHHLSNLLP